MTSSQERTAAAGLGWPTADPGGTAAAGLGWPAAPTRPSDDPTTTTEEHA